MTKNILGVFLEKLLSFPLWVKQIIYLRLYQNLAQSLSEDFIKIQERDIFHIYVPELTFVGRTELAERKNGHEPNLYTFLDNIAEGLTILEISMNHFWTMEEVAKYFVYSLEQDYIKSPPSVYVQAMAGFMSGKYRTGEYFKRTGKINVDQLEQTIIKQKEFADKGTPMKVAEVMISLGFITQKDTSSLLIIKEESKKRFILDASIVPTECTATPSNVNELQDENAKLQEQNKLLRNKLNQILAFVKKND